jgi:glycosyltransferase involved in cell wall biosynthesis
MRPNGSAGEWERDARRTPGRPLRICLASTLYRPAIGGEERHTELLADALARAGHRVCVATRRLPNTARRETNGTVQIERTVRPVSFGPFFGPTYAATLGWFLLRHRRAYDILQATYLYWDAVVAALLKPVLRSQLVVRVVMGGAGGDVERFCGMRLWPLTPRFDRRTLRRLVALVLRRGDAFITLNGETRAELVGLGVPPEKCHVVPNGIEVERFARITAPANREGPQRLLCVARLTDQKGHDVLLRALPAVSAAAGPISLTLLGDGPERDSLQSLATALGVSGIVRFAGIAPDVGPYLAETTAFVLPSRYEGLPLALLEAMAAGVPVVASAVPGNRDVVRDGVDGILVPAGDADALAKGIVQILTNGEMAGRLAAEARLSVAARYSAERMAEQTLRVYSGALRVCAREAWR